MAEAIATPPAEMSADEQATLANAIKIGGDLQAFRVQG
jgi:hypothetical protein